MLARRVHVLLDHERLARRSRATGASVGALIRQAIDHSYPPELPAREEALRRFLDAEPVETAEWPDLKAEIRQLDEPSVE